MEKEVRKSGIDIIGNVPWGTHFCQFYQTKQDLIDTLVPYFKAGLENNEFCMCVTADNLTAEDARKAISKVVPGFNRYVKKGQIEILPYDEWYLKDGVFKSQDVLNGWVSKLEQALAKGFDGLRLTGNTFWLEKEHWQSFTDYEEAVNNVIGKYNMIALCTYCLDKCDAAEIVDVIRNHEFAMIKQAGKWELFENSRYKTTKEALVESERRFFQLYHSMTEGLALHNVVYNNAGKAIDYIITDVNPAYEQITRIKASDAICRKASELYGASEPPYLDIYAKVVNTGEATKFETYFPPMGKHFNVSVFSPEKGKFATVFSDITERKESEKKLIEQATMLTHAGDAIIGYDAGFRVTYWNPGAEKIYGYSAAEAMGKVSNQLLKPIYYNLSRETLIERIATEGHIETESHRYAKDGRLIYVDSHVIALRGDDGKISSYVAVDRDITERKRVEEKLRETSDYLNNLLDYANAPIILWDPQFRITRFNHAFERLAGISASEAIGKRLDILFPESSKTDSMAFIRRASAGERWETVEIPILGAGGSIRTVLWNSATLVGVDGKKMVATIAQGQDITERKRAEEEVRNLNEELKRHASELEAANRELEAFSYSVSHDLRAPLRSMEGFSQALLEDYSDKLDDSGRDYLKRIQNSAEMMSQLIDDLLRLSRLTRFDMRFEAVNLSNMAESVASSLQKTQPEREVKFIITPGLEAEGDERLLGVVLDNLLGNAWKFTGKIPEAEIQFGVSKKGGNNTYFVRDNGAGFDAKYIDKLFKPFQRLHSSNEFPGTGIGLASVQRIIRRHGGQVWAEGKPGQGATFYFTLGG